MNKNKKLISLLIISLFMLLPFNVNAANKFDIKHYNRWTESTSDSGLGLKNATYHTRLGSSSKERETKYMGIFRIKGGNYNDCTEGGKSTSCLDTLWYCVEPGVPLESGNKITGAQIVGESKAPNASTDKGWTWTISSSDKTYLSRLFSCWYNNRYSIMATQILTWEIVTEERSSIDYDKIIKNNIFKPYESGGSVFGSRTGVTSLYELVSSTGSGNGKLGNESSREKLYQAYKETLSCAARLDINKMPNNNFYSKDSNARSHPIKVANYDAKTEKFSQTISNSELDYYTIGQYIGLDSSEVKLKNGVLTITTGKEIKSSSPAVIRLDYKYITKSGVDGSSHSIRADGNLNFLVKKQALASGKYPQALARGSTVKSIYISVYTGEKPKYQLKIHKQDDSSPAKPLQGVSFYVCSSNVVASGGSCNNSNKLTTITTNASGDAVYQEIEHIGSYVVKESKTLDGYVIDGTPQNVTVTENHKKGSAQYATTTKPFVNKKQHLIMNKRTLDSDGKESLLENDSCKVAVCEDGRENGPIFIIEQNGKKMCVVQLSDGNYRFNSLAEKCPEGTTEKIKTCNGKFDIELVPSGKYVVTEISTSCGTTLPSNPSQEVEVKENQETTTITMLNGVTGIVFTKVTENGALLTGGKFALQKKENGIYKDILLIHKAGAIYDYQKDITTETTNATYILETENGIINVTNLPMGDYRMVEKQAPEGYDLIKEKDSNAKVTISDKNTTKDDKTIDYYQIKLVNRKTKMEGSVDSAELVITINTGRTNINYPLVFAILVALLIIGFIIRRKYKK